MAKLIVMLILRLWKPSSIEREMGRLLMNLSSANQSGDLMNRKLLEDQQIHIMSTQKKIKIRLTNTNCKKKTTDKKTGERDLLFTHMLPQNHYMNVVRIIQKF